MSGGVISPLQETPGNALKCFNATSYFEGAGGKHDGFNWCPMKFKSTPEGFFFVLIFGFVWFFFSFWGQGEDQL